MRATNRRSRPLSELACVEGGALHTRRGLPVRCVAAPWVGLLPLLIRHERRFVADSAMCPGRARLFAADLDRGQRAAY